MEQLATCYQYTYPSSLSICSCFFYKSVAKCEEGEQKLILIFLFYFQFRNPLLPTLIACSFMNFPPSFHLEAASTLRNSVLLYDAHLEPHFLIFIRH